MMGTTVNDISKKTLLFRNPDIVFSEIDNEVVMLGPGMSKYFGMAKSAARIWQILEKQINYTNLCQNLIDEFEVTPDQCETDVLPFLSLLCQYNLVQQTQSNH